MKKSTMLFDGNHFLHRALGVAGNAKHAECGQQLDFIGDPEGDKRMLLSKMCDMFGAEVSRFSAVVDRVAYCVDSSSWRKVAFPDDGYKGNRVKSSDVNWQGVTLAYEEFQAGLTSAGVSVVKAPGAEGDDLLFYLSQTFNCGGVSTVVVTGDNDLLQLIGKDKATGAFTVVYNKTQNELSVFQGFRSFVAAKSMPQEFDVFSEPAFSDEGWEDVIKLLRAQIVEVDPARFVFSKVLTGDAGDNVRSVFQRVKDTKAGPMTYRFTEKMAANVLSRYERRHMFFGQHQMFDDKCIAEVASLVAEEAKVTEEEGGVQPIVERWKKNRDLVYLHANCIPPNVLSAMEKAVERMSSFNVCASTLSNSIANGCPSLARDAREIAPAGHTGGFDRDAWAKYRS